MDFRIGLIAVLLLVMQPFVVTAQENVSLPVIKVGEALSCKDVAALGSIASNIEYTVMGEGELLMEGARKLKVFHADEKFVYVAMINTVLDAGCYKFTKEGKLVSSFVYKGRQGSEFGDFMDIDIAADTKMIAVRDLTKVMIYDLDGKFVNYVPVWNIGNKNADFLGTTVNFLNGGKILLHGMDLSTQEAYAIVYDIDGKLIMRKKISEPLFSRKIKVPMGDGYATVYAQQAFSTWNGQVKLITQAEDVIYSMDGQMNKKPSYFLDFGKYRSASLEKDWEEHKVQVSISQFQESSRFIMFCITLGGAKDILWGQDGEDGRMLTILYDKKSKKTHALKYDRELGIAGFVNDIDGGMRFKPVDIIGNKMYRFIDAETFISIAANSSSAKMKEVASRLSEESNPVLVTVTLL